MRSIDLIVIHCSDSSNSDHNDISVVDAWHKERGFIRKRIPAGAANKIHKSVGYHFFIKTDGTIQIGRDLEEIGSHVKEFNSNSIGICLHGKKESDFTEAQFISCRELIAKYIDLYKLEAKDVVPHNALNKDKSCPNFDINEKILKGLYN